MTDVRTDIAVMKSHMGNIEKSTEENKGTMKDICEKLSNINNKLIADHGKITEMNKNIKKVDEKIDNHTDNHWRWISYFVGIGTFLIMIAGLILAN